MGKKLSSVYMDSVFLNKYLGKVSDLFISVYLCAKGLDTLNSEEIDLQVESLENSIADKKSQIANLITSISKTKINRNKESYSIDEIEKILFGK